MTYSAYELNKKSRRQLLQRFVPTFDEVIAHHITHRFPDKTMPPRVKSARVIGYAVNDKIEAFVVEINGKTERPDGKTYHITYSLDKDKGAKPVHSNKLLLGGWKAVGPIDIEVKEVLL